MAAKMQSCLPSACLLCCILVPMVGTVPPFYQRENVWQQFRPYSDNLFSLSSGNVWQDQPSWNPPRSFHTGNIWHQEPFSDSSASIYSGIAWQQWPSLDSPSPVQPKVSYFVMMRYSTLIHDGKKYIAPGYSSQLMFPTPFGNERSRGINECRHFQYLIWEKECEVCLELISNIGLPKKCCDMVCPSPFVPNK